MAVSGPRILSESNSSKVVLASPKNGEQPSIIKVVWHAQSEKKALLNELKITENLDIPGIRKANRLGEFEGSPALYLDYIEGEDLASIAQKRPFSLIEILTIGQKLCILLEKIHLKNIIHKNLNPSNILLENDHERVHLIDFSIAASINIQANIQHNPGEIEGELLYISPEQTGRMNHPIDYRSDFYSLGVVIYEMLTNSLPFESDDPLELIHAHIARLPKPVHELNPAISPALSRIVAKLLNKNVEDRYQSAAGIRHDLAFCLTNLEAKSRLADFQIGLKDHPTQFKIPEKLYGRDKEIQEIKQAFERTNGGRSELVLVKGYSGIGKSALIQEFHQSVLDKSGYFISGKFNEYHTNIPFEAFIQAFKSWVDILLTEKDQILAYWKDLILEAVHGNGKILLDNLPVFEIILGKQPELPELNAAEKQNRFNRILSEFVIAISKPEHPIVLFLDDLQWADSASLSMLKLLMEIEDNENFMIIGAYRDNEVDESHPLSHILDDLNRTGTSITNLTLDALQPKQAQQLISETLNTSQVEDLSEIIYEKTQGNPFFLKEFLKTVYKNGLFSYNTEKRSWQWDLEGIHALKITENVVEFIANKIISLPPRSQKYLNYGASLGSSFSIQTLKSIFSESAEEILHHLEPAIKAGYINPNFYNYHALWDTGTVSFSFPHDRVRQAFYSQIEDKDLPKVHLNIARSLHKEIEGKELDNHIFDITNHYKLGLELISDLAEEKKLVKLFYEAGLFAKKGAAYGPAVDYFQQAIDLLPENMWQSDYRFCLPLHEEACEAAYSSNQIEKMHEFARTIEANAKNAIDKARTYKTLLYALDASSNVKEAMEVTIRALRELDLPLKMNPNMLDVAKNLIAVKLKLRGKSVKDLLNLPKMTDPRTLAQIDIIYASYSIAYRSGFLNFYANAVFKSILLSLKYGNAPESALAYSLYGVVLAAGFNDYKGSLKFGDLSLRLEAQNDDRRYLPFLSAAYFTVIFHLKEPAGEVLKHFRYAHQVAKDSGNLFHAGSTFNSVMNHGFWTGENLNSLMKEGSRTIKFIRGSNQIIWAYWAEMSYQMAANLIGTTHEPWTIDGQYFSAEQAIRFFKETGEKTAQFDYHLACLYSYLLFNKTDQALLHGVAAIEYIPAVPGRFQYYIFLFYYCILLLRDIPYDKAHEHKKTLKEFKMYAKKFEKVQKFIPLNFANKAYLLKAEMARIQGKDGAAIDAYNHAIKTSRDQRFISEEALAQELAGKFFSIKGNEVFAQHYLQQAYQGWNNWGAHAKAVHLREEFPNLIVEEQDSFRSDPATLLDLNSVLKASTAISGEIVLEKLLNTLMHVLLENAGAQKGVLLEEKANGYIVKVTGNAQEGIKINSDEKTNAFSYPESIINYVARAKHELVLDNANSHDIYSKDPYVQRHGLKSVLCFPLMRQDKLYSIIYLENNLSTNAFTPARLELLRTLSSQISISLENAELYDNLEEKVQELQKTVNIFSKFVPQSVVEKALSSREGAVIKGEIREAAVLFCDIRDFTPLSEELAPDKVVLLLNDFYSTMTDIVIRHFGSINQFIGDEIYATFGAPISYPDIEQSAVFAALEMLEKREELNISFMQRFGVQIDIGIGVHAGKVIAGNIGSDERMNYGVVGNTVNTGKRIESLTHNARNSILISDAVYQKVSHLIQSKSWGPVSFKGKKTKVHVHQVLGKISN